MRKATAALLGTSCATCKTQNQRSKIWLNVILLEENEGKHRNVSPMPSQHKMSNQISALMDATNFVFTSQPGSTDNVFSASVSSSFSSWIVSRKRHAGSTFAESSPMKSSQKIEV
jgi:hypothetical protein